MSGRGARPQSRKGGADTVGNRAEKQDAHALSEAMMKVYNKSVPRVKPAA